MAVFVSGTCSTFRRPRKRRGCNGTPGGTRLCGRSARRTTRTGLADLIAAAVPVIPFLFLPIQPALIVALVVTGLWMALLGIARGRIGGVNIWRSAAQTMTIAGAAELEGVLMGRLVTTH